MREGFTQAVGGLLLAAFTCAQAATAPPEPRPAAPVVSATLAAAPAAAPTTAVPVAPSRDADPALWVLKDSDTTIYLFGTIHVLRPGLAWFDEAIAQAFDAADELRTEVVMPDDPAALVPVMLRYARDTSGRTLSSKLSPQQLETWRSAAGRLGLPAEQLEPFEPWFVGLQLSIGMLVSLGMDPSHGAEEVLRAEAKARGMRLTSFETVEEQMAFMDATPESEQIAGMIEILEDAAKTQRELEELVDGWARGEPERTGALLNESMADAPVTRRVLLTDRNRRWADSIRARMEEPGTVFIAVGAGHLAGKDSVQDFLARLGLKATRVEY